MSTIQAIRSSSPQVLICFKVNLDLEAGQPVIHALPTGGFLTAAEYNNTTGSGGKLRVRHYPSLAALYSGSFDREKTIDRTLSTCNEGTPNIYSASLNPNIDNSVIDIGFHYHKSCNVDRQARGKLTNFTSWNAVAEVALDTTLKNAASASGQIVGGNIGDRDQMSYDGKFYNLHEVQYKKNDFSTWRIYLYDWQTNSAAYLPIITHGGSTAIANPAFTNLTSPSGNPAVVATMFVPHEGAASWENGQLIYYREYQPDLNAPVGLTATYFDNKDFTGTTTGKINPQVNFDWGAGAPNSGFGADQFSVRWTGHVLADKNEMYTFHTQNDDGIRLWVNGVQLINSWTDSGVVERSGTIALQAGQQYDIKMEYYDNTGSSLAKLLWSSPTTPKAMVPQDHLFQTKRGLLARYYTGTALSGASKARYDANVDFTWGAGSGESNTGTNNFSVSWTGKVIPAYSQTYTFYTITDDGVRLWVNGIQLVNDWRDRFFGGAAEKKGTITLQAGQQYDIKMEYYEKSSNAAAKLYWSSPSVPKQIIPREALIPALQ